VSLPESHRVCNFTVERDHVHYVGDLTALVHNNGCMVDNNLGPKIAEELRNRGVDAIHVQELFGKDPGDPAIREAAKILDVPVPSEDMGRDKMFGGGVGDNRIKVNPKANLPKTQADITDRELERRAGK
jgi:hypothetical protein